METETNSNYNQPASEPADQPTILITKNALDTGMLYVPKCSCKPRLDNHAGQKPEVDISIEQ